MLAARVHKEPKCNWENMSLMALILAARRAGPTIKQQRTEHRARARSTMNG